MQEEKKRHDPQTFLTGVLVILFVVNQFLIGSVAEVLGKHSVTRMFMSITTNTASAQTIIMPILNDDGKTTSLKEMPTITPMPANPDTADAVADAMVVMLGKGTTFYAPDGASFDDPVEALAIWGRYERGIELTPEMEERYKRLTMLFTCNFCCGGPMNVTVIGRCGCAHAKAARGFFRYMLSTYGNTYSDEQLVGEAYRWQAVWYPSGVVEDYLLATGHADVLGHKSHGGVGTDGMHGFIAR